jgi:hypothetical protein
MEPLASASSPAGVLIDIGKNMENIKNILSSSKMAIASRNSISENLENINQIVTAIVTQNCEMTGELRVLRPILENVNNDVKHIKRTLSCNEQVNLQKNNIKKKQDPIVLVKPKTKTQNMQEITKEIKDTIDPSLVGATGLIETKNALILKCKNDEGIKKAKEEIHNKLGEKYEVKTPNNIINPSLKIVGLNEKLSNDVIIKNIKTQNMFMEDEDNIKILTVKERESINERNKTYTIYVDVSPKVYNKLLKHEKVNIGWSRCRI